MGEFSGQPKLLSEKREERTDLLPLAIEAIATKIPEVKKLKFKWDGYYFKAKIDTKNTGILKYIFDTVYFDIGGLDDSMAAEVGFSWEFKRGSNGYRLGRVGYHDQKDKWVFLPEGM